jgi:hypothetical protein
VSLGILLAVSLFAAPPAVELSAGAGVASNTFELNSTPQSATAAAPEPGAFVPITAAVNLSTDAVSPVRIAVRSWFEAELFAMVAQDRAVPGATHASDASHGSGYAGVPVSWRPVAESDRVPRLTFAFEPFAGAHRETFTSPITGRPYVANGVSLGKRFDDNRGGARASGEAELGSAFDVYAALQLQRVDYVQDYRGVPGVDSWDYIEARADTDAYAYAGPAVFSAAYSFKRRGYDSRFPHDVSGNAITTAGYAPQVFLIHDVTLRAGLTQDARRAVLRYDLERRTDANGGYLSYTDHSVALDLRADARSVTFELHPSFSMRSYDAAHVNYDPLEPSFHRTRFDVAASAEHPLRDGVVVFLQAGFSDQWSSNALYTFSAARVMTGVRVRWE